MPTTAFRPFLLDNVIGTFTACSAGRFDASGETIAVNLAQDVVASFDLDSDSGQFEGDPLVTNIAAAWRGAVSTPLLTAPLSSLSIREFWQLQFDRLTDGQRALVVRRAQELCAQHIAGDVDVWDLFDGQLPRRR